MTKFKVEVFEPGNNTTTPDYTVQSGFAAVEAGGILKYFEADEVCNYLVLTPGTRVRVSYVGLK